MHSLDPLIRPRSIALVGASADPARTAGKPLGYLRKHGYNGRLYIVNPRRTSIDGIACFASVAELPEAPDVGLVLVGPEAATDAVRELRRRGALSAIVLAGGYAEIDATGAQRQADLAQAADGLRLLGPNTIGVVNVVDHVALSASSALELDRLAPGGVGVVSQSGGMLGALLSRGTAHGVGFSRLISTGNEADIDVCDAIDYLLQDDSTRVIALYLESVRRPEQFREAAVRAQQRAKHLVVLKIGRSSAGAQSTLSHTGALAGTDRVYDALFDRTDTIRVATLDELIDVSAALVRAPALHGNRLAILTSTGGGGSLIADACGLRGFAVPAPDTATADRLCGVLRGESAAADRNPIDLTLANLRSETYRDTLAALLESPSFDAMIVVVGSSGLGDPSLAAGPVVEAAHTARKPIVVYVNPHALNIVSYLNSAGVPAFATAEGCAAALAALRHAAPTAEPLRPVRDTSNVRTLDTVESLALFAQHGIPVVRQRLAKSPPEAAEFASRLGRLVVVKAIARDTAHKSDVGAVRLGVAHSDVAGVCEALRPLAARGWLVQEHIVGAAELLLGVIRDPQLGLAIILGAGGVATEVFDDTALCLLPLRPQDPEQLLARLQARKLLEGFRGRPPADIDAVLDILRRFAAFAESFGDDLLEAEINPLLVLPRGDGALAVDGLVVLRS